MIDLSIRWCVLIRSVWAQFSWWFDLISTCKKKGRKWVWFINTFCTFRIFYIKIWYQFVFLWNDCSGCQVNATINSLDLRSVMQQLRLKQFQGNMMHLVNAIYRSIEINLPKTSREREGGGGKEKNPSIKKSTVEAHHPMIRLSFRFVGEHGSKVIDCIQLRTFKHDFHVPFSSSIII